MNYDKQLDAMNLLKQAFDNMQSVENLTPDFHEACVFINAARNCIATGLNKIVAQERVIKPRPDDPLTPPNKLVKAV